MPNVTEIIHALNKILNHEEVNLKHTFSLSSVAGKLHSNLAFLQPATPILNQELMTLLKETKVVSSTTLDNLRVFYTNLFISSLNHKSTESLSLFLTEKQSETISINNQKLHWYPFLNISLTGIEISD